MVQWGNVDIILLEKDCNGALTFVHFRLNQFKFPASYAFAVTK